MKTKSITILTLALTLFLASCNSNGNNVTDNTKREQSATLALTGGTNGAEIAEKPPEDASPEPQAVPAADWDRAANTPAGLEPAPESDFTYKYNAAMRGIEITAYKGKTEELLIPDTIEGEPVVHISGLTSGRDLQFIYFPAHIEKIKSGALSGNENLTLVLPEKAEIYDEAISKVKNLDITDNLLEFVTGPGRSTKSGYLLLDFFKFNGVETVRYNGNNYNVTDAGAVAELYGLIVGGSYEETLEVRKNWGYFYSPPLDGIILTSCNADTIKITFPSMVEGKPVVSAVRDVFKHNRQFVEVTVPDSVKYLPLRMFSDLKLLTAVNLPDGIALDEKVFSPGNLSIVWTLPDNVIIGKELPVGVFIDGDTFSTSPVIFRGTEYSVYEAKTDEFNAFRDDFRKMMTDLGLLDDELMKYYRDIVK